MFGSNPELRAIAEFYGCDDANAAFVQDFSMAWAKVMDLDRFDKQVCLMCQLSYLVVGSVRIL